MQTLYEAANAIEAHMLLDLLRQEGFSSAHMHGEHLQGAMGELPAAGLVRLVIDEEEYARARRFIADWEALQVDEPSSPPPAATRRRGRGWWLFLGGLLLGAGGTAAYMRVPASSDGVDYNGDGLLDETWTFSARGTPLRLELDRNLDHKVDYIALYDERGHLASATGDDDFDGRFETRLSFIGGNVETIQIDTDGDGYPDLFSYHDSGVLRTTEFRDPKTGQPYRVENYRLGRTVYADVDTDGDGKLDTRIRYSGSRMEESREPLPP